MLSSMCTARVKRSKRKNGEYGATFRPCDVHKYLLGGLSFIQTAERGEGGRGSATMWQVANFGKS